MPTYPRKDVPHRLRYWIGCKNWKRFTPKQQSLIRELKKFNRSFSITWTISSVHPTITLLNPNQQHDTSKHNTIPGRGAQTSF